MRFSHVPDPRGRHRSRRGRPRNKARPDPLDRLCSWSGRRLRLAGRRGRLVGSEPAGRPAIGLGRRRPQPHLPGPGDLHVRRVRAATAFGMDQSLLARRRTGAAFSAIRRRHGFRFSPDRRPLRHRTAGRSSALYRPDGRRGSGRSGLVFPGAGQGRAPDRVRHRRSSLPAEGGSLDGPGQDGFRLRLPGHGLVVGRTYPAAGRHPGDGGGAQLRRRRRARALQPRDEQSDLEPRPQRRTGGEPMGRPHPDRPRSRRGRPLAAACAPDVRKFRRGRDAICCPDRHRRGSGDA
ncbi:hypothetical protein D3C73_718060 [compost metagenome]